MDFPVDIWGILNNLMNPREFAKICSTSRASYAVRQPLVAAEARYDMGDDDEVLLRQLQLSKWPTCHSLCINLGELLGIIELSQAQRGSIDEAGSKMPSLHCLHLIGRGRVSLTESTIEGVLVSLLARHAAVVTMQVENILIPLKLPDLQHLVLDIASSTCVMWDPSWIYWTLSETLQMLRGLKTLRIQSCGPTILGSADLTGCGHLECVAVQGVAFAGGLQLPDGCSLHATNVPKQVDRITNDVAHLLTGLTLCGCSTWDTAWWYREWLRCNAPCMFKLTRLRIISCYPGEMPLVFRPRSMPNLEVLELDVQRDLYLYIHPGLALKRLVVITTGCLRFDKLVLMQEDNSAPRLTELYLQSGAAILPSEMDALLARCPTQLRAQVKLTDYFKDKEHKWTAQMPASLQPGNLRECCCSAYPECLVRGGVPVLCDKAWTRDGFEKHLKPHVRRSTQHIEHALSS